MTTGDGSRSVSSRRDGDGPSVPPRESASGGAPTDPALGRSRSEADPAFSVLCVCTGNVCRSPAAERLLARALGATVRVSSAGTHALVGEAVSPPMDRLIEDWGADPTAFVARSATPDHLRAADLVLGLTRQHRTAVVDIAPGVVRRTFTLREYARLLGQIEPGSLTGATPGERARRSVTLAAALRRPSPAGADDVPDPYRRGPRAYASSFAEIDTAVRQIAAVLAP